MFNHSYFTTIELRMGPFTSIQKMEEENTWVESGERRLKTNILEMSNNNK